MSAEAVAALADFFKETMFAREIRGLCEVLRGNGSGDHRAREHDDGAGAGPAARLS
jgi:hypothetical protein